MLQTKYSYIPANKVGNNSKISVQKYIDSCLKNKTIPQINYSEMTFYTKNIKNDTNLLNISIDKTKTNIIYMGRLMGLAGLDIIYLMKLMKRLGNQYHLYIAPGSFMLPNLYPMKKMRIDNPKNFKLLKTYIENYELIMTPKHSKIILPKYRKEDYLSESDDCKLCNITVINPLKYGDHFNFLHKMDIGLCFSPDKYVEHPEGSAKLFDYMYSKLLIVCQNGWGNSEYIEKYNFGKIISSNASVIDYVNAIKYVVNNMNKNSIKYDEYLNDHNYLTRAEQFLKIVTEK